MPSYGTSILVRINHHIMRNLVECPATFEDGAGSSSDIGTPGDAQKSSALSNPEMPDAEN